LVSGVIESLHFTYDDEQSPSQRELEEARAKTPDPFTGDGDNF